MVASVLDLPVDCANPSQTGMLELRHVGLFSDRQQRKVVVVVTTDGRRVTVPVRDLVPRDNSLLGLALALLAGLEDLLGLLITGSRRENGGTRRDRRQ
jgi:hypothetical protein